MPTKGDGSKIAILDCFQLRIRMEFVTVLIALCLCAAKGSQRKQGNGKWKEETQKGPKRLCRVKTATVNGDYESMLVNLNLAAWNFAGAGWCKCKVACFFYSGVNQNRNKT